TGSDGPFTVHTRWIETEFVNEIKPFVPAAEGGEEGLDGRETLAVEVGGRRIEVRVPASLGVPRARTAPGMPWGRTAPGVAGARTVPGGARQVRRRPGGRGAGSAVSGDTLTSPMQGTIVKVAVEEGATVAAGDLVVVLEAMKMEQPITAHKAGTVADLLVRPGAALTADAAICAIRE
ncbi:biotin/lipoyl-containing protein, partial [Streptomyces sp. CoH27]|uniref:biotin/lipoyl-containing protein n=1 Tax=Streptomyces sp. CoH27 TaxID=2875763 RepID=UPI0027E0CAD5